MLLVVGGIKGGSGKTTLATNLTVMRASAGKKVLLVDADEQGSASDWVEQRTYQQENNTDRASWVTIKLSGKMIHSQLQKMKSDYDDIIIDTGGRDTTSQRSSLICADQFLLPFKPRSIDIWTMGSVRRMISEIQAVNPNLKCSIVINQADAKGSDNKDSHEILSEFPEIQCLNVMIGNRKAFSNAASDGLGVAEMVNKDPKALKEMSDLYKLIYI